MHYVSFRDTLKRALMGPLPGEKGQLAMAPEFRGEIAASGKPIPAAVMILLFPSRDNTGLVFIKRNPYNGPHSAQVSFPGGAWEPGDASLEETAVRETREELGIRQEIQILGSLTPLHIPVSNFMVTPYAGWMDERPVFKPDPTEVQYVIETTLTDLLNPANVLSGKWEQHKRNITAPYYRVGKEKIWGATAMMLCEFLLLAARMQKSRC